MSDQVEGCPVCSRVRKRCVYHAARDPNEIARTLERDYVLEESLVQLEQEFPQRLLRLHRNCLVARAAVQGVERVGEPDAEGHWEVLLKGVDERLPVSRRQWPAVRQALRL